jgi:polyisoprenoid-binding protein YceI
MKTFSTAFAAVAGAAVLVVAAPAWAQAANGAKLVPAQSEIAFVSKQMGVPVEGRFKKFDAQIAFDPKKPEAGKVAFSIDLGSAALGAPETEAELVKAAWFNVPKFPQATFQSSTIKSVGAGKYEVAGQLNIKGNAHSVVVPVTLTQANGSSTASGAFAIKRLDFKIGEGEWADTSMVANDVQVKFKLTLTGLAPM